MSIAIIGSSEKTARQLRADAEDILDELKWELVGICNGRLDAEMLQSYLEAHGIEVVVIQEAVGHNIYPVTIDGLGRVQLFVSKENSATARELITDYRKPPKMQ